MSGDACITKCFKSCASLESSPRKSFSYWKPPLKWLIFAAQIYHFSWSCGKNGGPYKRRNVISLHNNITKTSKSYFYCTWFLSHFVLFWLDFLSAKCLNDSSRSWWSFGLFFCGAFYQPTGYLQLQFLVLHNIIAKNWLKSIFCFSCFANNRYDVLNISKHKFDTLLIFETNFHFSRVCCIFVMYFKHWFIEQRPYLSSFILSILS